MKMDVKYITTDVLIVGSGGAGSRAAIEVDNAGLKATIVSKGLSFRSGCTGIASGDGQCCFHSASSQLMMISSAIFFMVFQFPAEPESNTPTTWKSASFAV